MTGDLSNTMDRPTVGSPTPHGGNGLPVHGDPDIRTVEPSLRVEPVELCRLTVLAQSVQVDLALPTDVPISALVPGIVGLLGSRGPAHTDSADIGADRHGRPWVLSRVGEPPIPETLTLDDASISDGELLVLGTADAPAQAPLFDDLMSAVATIGTARSGLWTARIAQLAGFGVGSVAVVLACSALVRSLFDGASAASVPVDAGVGAAVAAILFVVAGAIVGRVHDDDRTGVFLSGCALPLMFTAGVVFVPGVLGAPHVLLGASATGACAILAMRLGGHGTAVFTGTATASAITAAAAATVSFTDLPIGTVGAAMTLCALAGLAAAPRLSMMQAHLPLPPVPTAGAPLDEVADDEMPTIDELDRLSGRARSYLTGLVCAACIAATAGALLAALGSGTPQNIYWPGIALAVLTALVLILRGRTFAEVQHAVPLVAAGSIIYLSLLATVVFTAPLYHLVAFGTALAVAVAAVGFGSFVPRRVYSPVLRRAAELVEYTAIAAIIPLVCWVCGLYSAMRGL